MPLINMCKQCKNKLATHYDLCEFCAEEWLQEYEKCKTNPYYYATKYLTINGKPFTTLLTEEQFNNEFKSLQNGTYIGNKGRLRNRPRTRGELK